MNRKRGYERLRGGARLYRPLISRHHSWACCRRKKKVFTLSSLTNTTPCITCNWTPIEAPEAHKALFIHGPARPGLAARDGDAAGGERAAGVGAVDVLAVRRVVRVLAEAPLLRVQVRAAVPRGRRPADDRGQARRQLLRLAVVRRGPARAHRHHDECQGQQHRYALRPHHAYASFLSLSLSAPVHGRHE
jgi:hypothetical protein